ncbi:MAG: PAS domain S-box protein [Candidatus Sumerlaeaceae bacterium]
MTAEDTNKEAQRLAQRKDQGLRALLEAAADAYFLHDEEGRILDVNQRAWQSLGYLEDELLRLHVWNIEPQLEREKILEMWRRMQPGDTETLQGTHRRKDGSTFPVEIKLAVVWSTEGEKHFVALVRDMTEHQRGSKVREVLSSLGQRLSAITSLRDAGLVILDSADDLFGWDAAFVELYDGRTSLLHNIAYFDLIDDVRTETFPSHDAPVPGSNTEKALRHGPQLLLRARQEQLEGTGVMMGDIERRSASLMFVPIRKDQQPIGIISIQSYQTNAYTSEDLHLLEALADYCSGAFDRIFVQERLREAEQRFTIAFEHAPIGLGVLRPDGDWIRVNRSLCEIVGYTEHEMLATGLHGITCYEDLSRVLDELLSVYSGEKDFVNFESRLIHSSHRMVWVNFRASLVRDITAQPLYLIAQIQDITGQRRREQVQSAVRDLGQKLVAATTQQQVARLMLDTADTLFGWDAAFVDLFDEDSGSFRSIIVFDTIESEKRELGREHYEVEAAPNTHRTLAEGAQLILRDDVNTDPNSLHPFGSSQPSASLMYVPLRHEGRNVGVLSIQSYQKEAYTADDLNTLQELADYCCTSFDRAYAETKAAEAELALRQSQQRFEWVMRATTDAIYDWDIRSGSLWWNNNIEVLFGYASGHGETHIDWWSERIHPDDREASLESVNAALEAGKQSWSREYRFRCSDGTYSVVFDRGYYDDQGAVRAIGSMMDITQRKRAEEQLRRGAYHDALTELPNRTFFLEELERALARAKRREAAAIALLFLDLDGFKEVNDGLGHAAGDQLLVEVARVLCECVRPSDLVSRLAGDEFTIILYDLVEKSDAEAVARRILDLLQQPFRLRAGEVQTGGSIGIALSHGEHTEGHELLHDADAAMYKAKAGGKNQYCFFAPPTG